jgi:hypothetical protein
MLQALTFVAGAVAVCVALVLFYVVYSPRKPLEGAVAESAQSLDASSSSISAEAAPVESQGASGKGASDSPGVLVKPAVEEGQRTLDFRIDECLGGPRVQRHGGYDVYP